MVHDRAEQAAHHLSEFEALGVPLDQDTELTAPLARLIDARNREDRAQQQLVQSQRRLDQAGHRAQAVVVMRAAEQRSRGTKLVTPLRGRYRAGLALRHQSPVDRRRRRTNQAT